MKPIPYADKLPDESMTRYFMRLLTTVIAVSGGEQKEIRIPLQDLMDCAEGVGFIKEWDPHRKELILRFAAPRTEAFFGAQAEDRPASPISINRPPAPSSTSHQPEPVGSHIDLQRAEQVVHKLLNDRELERVEQTQRERELAKGGKLHQFIVR